MFKENTAEFRHCICFLMVFALIATMFCPSVYAAESEVVIPSPEAYFGEVDEQDTGKTYVAYYFYGYPTFPKETVEAYIDVLKDYGLETNQASVSSIVNLEHNGSCYVQIYWSESDEYEGGYLRVNIVQPYVAGEVAQDHITVTGPSDFFGSADGVQREDGLTLYYYQGRRTYPKAEMRAYVKALKKEGLKGGSIRRETGGDRVAILKYEDEEVLVIFWDKSDEIVYILASDILHMPDEPEPAPAMTETEIPTEAEIITEASTVAPTEAPTEAPVENSILILLRSFFGSPSKYFFDPGEYSTELEFKYSDYPEEMHRSFIASMEKLGLQSDDLYTGSNGFKSQHLYWGNDRCIETWWMEGYQKYEVTIYWSVVIEAGVFAPEDIPPLPEPDQPEPTEPAPTEPTFPVPSNDPNSVLNIVIGIFGEPLRQSYAEDRYQTVYYYSSASEPKSAFSKFRSEMESRGMSVYQHSFSSNGGKKTISCNAAGGSPVSVVWRKSTGQIEVTIKWEYVRKAGVFDTADIPEEPIIEPDPVPEGYIDCPDCDKGRCKACGGTGEVEGYMPGVKGKVDVRCKECLNGTCKTCYGDGKIRK